MARKVKNFLKRLGHAYMRGAEELYGPLVRYKISPLM